MLIIVAKCINRCETDCPPRQVVGSISTVENEKFSFRLSGNEAKRGVEFHHSIRNASRIRRNIGNGNVLTLGSLRFSLPTLLFAGCSVKLKKILI